MNNKLLLSAVAVGALICGQLVAAPKVAKKQPAPTVIEVFDPFLLTTVTETVEPVAVSAPTVTASEPVLTTTVKPVGTAKPTATSDQPIATSDVTIAEPVIVPNHHKPGHKSKKKPHPFKPDGTPPPNP